MVGRNRVVAASVAVSLAIWLMLPASVMASSMGLTNQTATTDPVKYRSGDTINYELSATNTNANPAVLTVTDTLPNGTVKVLDADRQFAAGETVKYELQYVADPDDAVVRQGTKVLINTLRVAGLEMRSPPYSPDEIDMTVTKSSVLIDPSLSIEKTVDFDGDGTYSDSETYAPGTASWKIVVTNDGDVPLNSVVIEDTNGMHFGPFDLNVGESVEKTYAAEVQESTVNTATAEGLDETQRVVGPVSDKAEAIVPPLGIELVKTSNADPLGVLRGTEVTYFYTVTNSEETTLYDVIVVDDKIGKIGTIDVLAPGDSATLSASAVLMNDTTNVAVATGTDEYGRHVSDNSIVSILVYLTLPPHPDMTIDKSATHTEARPGDVITYTLTYKVIGEGTVNSYAITDDYDERYVDIVDAAGATVSGGTLVWTFDTPLTEADGEQAITYTVRVKDDVAGGTNVDNAVVIDSEEDSDPDNNRDTWRVVVSRTPGAAGEPLLPFTGGQLGTLILFAGLALLAGFGARYFGRRRRGDGFAAFGKLRHILTLGVLVLVALIVLVPASESFAANLQMSKDTASGSPVLYRVGDRIDYVLDVTNTNAAPAVLDVWDVLPDGSTVTLETQATFAPGETKTYNLSYTIDASDVETFAVGGNTYKMVRNRMHADGWEQTDVPDHICGMVTESSTVIEPDLAIEKTVDFNDDGIFSDEETYRRGYPAVWRVVVTNTGDTALSDVTVVDTNGNDFGVPFSLDPGKSETFEYTTNPMSSHDNTATAEAVAVDGLAVGPVIDDASVITLDSDIMIDKLVDFDGDGIFSDEETGVAGDEAIWKITTTNTGETTLYDVYVNDTNGRLFGPYTLVPGQQVVEIYGRVASEDTTNVAEAVGADVFGLPVGPVTDDAKIHLIGPGISVSKLVDFDGDGIFSDEETGVVGDEAIWKITITNSGDSTLFDVTVTDSNGESFGPYATLAAGASVTETYATTPDADTLNTATATGTDENGNDYTDIDDAQVHLIVCAGSIAVEKTVDADGDGVFHDTETIELSSSSATSDFSYWSSNDDSCEGLPSTVYLQADHVGADSETFDRESDTGGLTAPVVWHFVLNGLDDGAPRAELKATFDSAGSITVTSRNEGRTQHFYVGTPGHDILLGAYAVVDSCETGNLVLSHVAVNEANATWKIVVTNDGTCDLTDVNVTDSNGKSFGPISLVAGESKTYTYTTTISGETVNVATAEGYDSRGNRYTDTDDATVLVDWTHTSSAYVDKTIARDLTDLSDVSGDGGTDPVVEEVAHPIDGATRNVAFWKTHPEYVDHVRRSHLGGRIDLGQTTLRSRADVMGALWANVARSSDGTLRSPLHQAKVSVSQQLVATILNSGIENGREIPAYGSTNLISAARSVLKSDDLDAINAVAAALADYNSGGRSIAVMDTHGFEFQPGDPGDSAGAQGANVTVFDYYSGPGEDAKDLGDESVEVPTESPVESDELEDDPAEPSVAAPDPEAIDEDPAVEECDPATPETDMSDGSDTDPPEEPDESGDESVDPPEDPDESGDESVDPPTQPEQASDEATGTLSTDSS